MPLNPDLPIPLYFQLKTFLIEEILRGTYKPGDRLPTEHELCAEHGISRTPIARALSELAEEGVVLRTRGKGTFVNPHWARRDGQQAEIRVVVPAEGPWDKIVDQGLAAVTPVNLAVVPRTELHHVLTHAVAEGQAPDLAVLDSVWVPEFAAAGFLHALEDVDSDWIEGEYESDFLEPLIPSTRYRGKTYGVPAYAVVAGLWYRRSELSSRDLEPPRTWTELLEVARTIRSEKGSPPLALPAGSRGGETTTYCLTGVLASNRASILDESAVVLDSPAAVEALQFLKVLIDEGVVAREAVSYEWNRPIRMLANGDVAICLGGSYEVSDLAASMKVDVHRVNEEFGFVAIPAGPRGMPASVTGTMVYAIFRQAPDPKRAMKLLEGLVKSEVLTEIARTTGRIPPRRSALRRASAFSPFVKMTGEILESAVGRPATPLYPRVSAQLASMLEAVVTGRHEPEIAVERTAEMIGAITGLPVLRQPGYIPRATPIG